MKKNICKLVSILLLLCLAAQLMACSTAQSQNLTENLSADQVPATDLMANITPKTVSPLSELGRQNTAATDFAVRLFKAGNEEGKSVLISPLSVMYALAMTANGADGQTLAQMESVLGMSVSELNAYLYSYMASLPQGEKYRLSLANSIWFTDHTRFAVDQNFLQTNADYYGADIYSAPMDQRTCGDINAWCREKTNGMIPSILDSIPENVVMYLINALAFEAEWSKVYTVYQVQEGKFTTEAGLERTAQLMYSEESLYLSDANATGFVKYYKGGKYAFVAMLPNAGVTLAEYVASLDGASLQALLENPQHYTVQTAIPQFEKEYTTEMSSVLKQMGIVDAFDETKADLHKLGASVEGNISVSRVLHKTYIKVDSNGTKAAAVTAVEPSDSCAPEPQQIKEVILDRPFLYMLIDCENNIPFFLGTVTDL